MKAVNSDPQHRPYITCWCPLDDVTDENDTVYILPQSTSGIRDSVTHWHDPETNDWVGYDGPLEGIIPVRVRAGSVAVFSSLTLHCSGPNRTNRLRRVYLTQYSPEPVSTADRRMLWGNAPPFLKDGRRVVGSAIPDLPLRIDGLLHAGQRLSDRPG